MDEGQLTPKAASNGWKLLKDSSFKLVQRIKLLEIDDCLDVFPSQGCQHELQHQLALIADQRLFVTADKAYWRFESPQGCCSFEFPTTTRGAREQT